MARLVVLVDDRGLIFRLLLLVPYKFAHPPFQWGPDNGHWCIVCKDLAILMENQRSPAKLPRVYSEDKGTLIRMGSRTEYTMLTMCVDKGLHGKFMLLLAGATTRRMDEFPILISIILA